MRFASLLLNLTLVLTANPPAFAADPCAPVRIDQKGGSMEHIPVMDQDGTGLCYAYVAAQMVDAYRFSHGDKKPDHLTSPLAAAVHYTIQREGSGGSLYWGWIHWTIEAIRDRGSYPHQRLSEKLGAYQIDGFLGEVRKYLDSLQTVLSASPERKPLAEGMACTLNNAGLTITDGLPFNANEIGVYLNDDYVSYLDQVFKKTCREDSIVQIPSLESPDFVYGPDVPADERKTSLLNAIHKNLRTPQSLPIGIHYCSDVLFNKETSGLDERGDIASTKCSGHHASMIVGQRKAKNGTCQLLIRNSAGSSCNAYSDWECEDGQIWVDEDRLANNLLMVTYFK